MPSRIFPLGFYWLRLYPGSETKEVKWDDGITVIGLAQGIHLQEWSRDNNISITWEPVRHSGSLIPPTSLTPSPNQVG